MPMFRQNLIIVEARQLVGTAVETMDVIDWIRNTGELPWLIGNATKPETLVPEGSEDVGGEGVYLDPANGNLVIHTHERDEKAEYGYWIVRQNDGTFEAWAPVDFEAEFKLA
jgi:hypothetical protein